mmetsp:Transcript_13677/g.38992  ORF Transcript_13677/g.38992 Transcript_13677/m.38992 type:complete len:323 (+) Transcript_13677:519-1487(+)
MVLVDSFPMNHASDQKACRACDVATTFSDDPDWCEPLRFDHLFVDPVDTCSNGGYINHLCAGLIGNPQTASKVDHLNTDVQLFVDGGNQAEEHPSRLHDLVDLEAVGDDHRVQAEAGHAQLLAPPVALEQLGPGQPELGLLRVADQHVARAGRPGVEAEADELGEAELPVHELDVREVVQVHDGARALGPLVLLEGCVVAREHDLLAPEAHLLGQDDLRDGGAVHAAALVAQDLADEGVRGRLHGEVVPVPRAPGEGGVQAADRLPNGPLVVEVEGRGEAPGHLQHLLRGPRKIRNLGHGAAAPGGSGEPAPSSPRPCAKTA